MKTQHAFLATFERRMKVPRHTSLVLALFLVVGFATLAWLANEAKKAGKSVPDFINDTLFGPGSVIGHVARTFLFGFAGAVAVLIGAAVFGAPLWLAASLAFGTFAATGAYEVAAGALGLPSLPGGKPLAPGSGSGAHQCPPGYVGNPNAPGVCVKVAQ